MPTRMSALMVSTGEIFRISDSWPTVSVAGISTGPACSTERWGAGVGRGAAGAGGAPRRRDAPAGRLGALLRYSGGLLLGMIAPFWFWPDRPHVPEMPPPLFLFSVPLTRLREQCRPGR